MRSRAVCKARWPFSDGALEGSSVYSCDEQSREYLYHGFKAGGWVSIDKGQRIPGGFRFLKEYVEGTDRVRQRFTIEEGVAGRVTTVLETAKGDGPWVIEDKSDDLRTRP